MRFELLLITLLASLGFTLSTLLEPALLRWSGERRRSDSFLGALLGDSQKMFANHFFVKADAYFHSGYYPGIFDAKPVHDEIHILGAATGAGEHEEEDHDHDHEHDHENEDHGFRGAPKDWLDRFGRNFIPNGHTHLGDSSEETSHSQHQGHDHGHSHDAANHHDHDHDGDGPKSEGAGGMEREMLPWLRLSASMDPQRVQTYVVGAYFLRNMKRDSEAESFLREGLKANPRSYEILFELGRLMNEARQDPEKACNIWEAGIRYWRDQEMTKPAEEQNLLAYASLLANLAKVQEARGSNNEAIQTLETLLEVSVSKDAIRKWLNEIKAKNNSNGSIP